MPHEKKFPAEPTPKINYLSKQNLTAPPPPPFSESKFDGLGDDHLMVVS